MYGTLFRHPLRSLLVAAGAVGLVRFARAARGVPTSLGASRRRLFPTVSGSPHYRAGQFVNRLPGTAIGAGGAPRLIIALLQHRDHGKPAGEVPVSRPEFPSTAADLAVTWLGHASALLEIDGHRLLFDPLFSARASPSARVGPLRMHPTPLDPAELPEVGGRSDHHLARSLRPSGPAHHPHPGRPSRRRSWSRSVSAPTYAGGASRTTGSPNWTGIRARKSDHSP